MPDGETYWVTTNKNNTNTFKLHPDRDCRILDKANDIREARDYEIRENDVCKVCTGETDRYRKNAQHDLHRKLERMNDE